MFPNSELDIKRNRAEKKHYSYRQSNHSRSILQDDAHGARKDLVPVSGTKPSW